MIRKAPLSHCTLATKRPGDRRYVVLVLQIPTTFEVRLGLVSPDHETWKARLVIYGKDKADARERAGLDEPAAWGMQK